MTERDRKHWMTTAGVFGLCGIVVLHDGPLAYAVVSSLIFTVLAK